MHVIARRKCTFGTAQFEKLPWILERREKWYQLWKSHSVDVKWIKYPSEHLWNIIDMEKPKYAETNLPQSHFSHHKPHMERAGVKTDPPLPPEWNAGDWASVWEKPVPACNYKSRNCDDIWDLFVYLHVMNMSNGADVAPQSFLISKWSDSHPHHFTSNERILSTYRLGDWVKARAFLDLSVKRK
jgi:hypothetical protein